MALHLKLFDTKVALLPRSGRLATREALITQVWPAAFVEEGRLSHIVSALRKELGEDQAGIDRVARAIDVT